LGTCKADLWCIKTISIGFLLKSVYNVLPMLTNLKTWGLVEDPNYKLCKRPGNLEHVFSSCKTVVTDGRFTWHHDKVLAEIADTIDMVRRKTSTVRMIQPPSALSQRVTLALEPIGKRTTQHS
jgi:hypothetical protein